NPASRTEMSSRPRHRPSASSASDCSERRASLANAVRPSTLTSHASPRCTSSTLLPSSTRLSTTLSSMVILYLMIPPEPDVPEGQRGVGSAPVRYEDVSEDGRIRLTSLSHFLGLALWQNAVANNGPSRTAARQGIVPVLTRLAFEGGSGPHSVRRPGEGRGCFQLAHTVDAAGRPRPRPARGRGGPPRPPPPHSGPPPPPPRRPHLRPPPAHRRRADRRRARLRRPRLHPPVRAESRAQGARSARARGAAARPLHLARGRGPRRPAPGRDPARRRPHRRRCADRLRPHPQRLQPPRELARVPDPLRGRGVAPFPRPRPDHPRAGPQPRDRLPQALFCGRGLPHPPPGVPRGRRARRRRHLRPRGRRPSPLPHRH